MQNSWVSMQSQWYTVLTCCLQWRSCTHVLILRSEAQTSILIASNCWAMWCCCIWVQRTMRIRSSWDTCQMKSHQILTKMTTMTKNSCRQDLVAALLNRLTMVNWTCRTWMQMRHLSGFKFHLNQRDRSWMYLHKWHVSKHKKIIKKHWNLLWKTLTSSSIPNMRSSKQAEMVCRSTEHRPFPAISKWLSVASATWLKHHSMQPKVKALQWTGENVWFIDG